MKGGVTMWALNQASGFVKGCVIVGALLIVIVGYQSAASLFGTAAKVGGQSVHLTFEALPVFFGEVKGGKADDNKSVTSGDAPIPGAPDDDAPVIGKKK